MAEKRKDSHGILLEKGETQLSSGKYRYRYYDDTGTPHEVTAWRLRPNDPTPDGKPVQKSLRELEKEIRKQLEDGLKAWGGAMTVKELVKEHMKKQEPFWAANTISDKNTHYKYLESSKLGRKKVSKVTPEDIEQYYTDLCTGDNKMMLSTVAGTNKLLNPAFKYAVKKRMIPVNPVSGVYGEVKRKIGEQKTQRHALEESELETLLSFIQEKYPAWYPLFYFLAWTGCRIGEALGLSWQNVDFQNEVIHITKTLEYVPVNGKYRFVWKEPKTEAGVREIPMLKDVKKILLELRPDPGKVTDINARTKEPTLKDLVFVGVESGAALPARTVQARIDGIIKQYNKKHEDQLPHVTCHIFRHTFVCWLIECFSCGENASLLDNLKYIQKILGHSDASTTLNVYAELRKDKLNEKHDMLRKAAQR